MNPQHQLDTNGQSSRANKGVKQSLSHLAGGKLPVNQLAAAGGQPGPLPTLTPPMKGATPPTAFNPSQEPGKGASNPLITSKKGK